MFVFTPRLVCALLLSAVLLVDAAAPGTSECAPQEIPNMVVDVTNAVINGARFSDPIICASVEECVSACCSQLNSAGDRTCNVAVYDTRKSKTFQNCYLFFCPDLDSCPMSPSRGVLSYAFGTESEKRNSDSEDSLEIPKDSSQVQDSSGKESSSAVQAAVSAEPGLEEELSPHGSDKKSSSSDVRSPSETDEVRLPAKEDGADSPDHIASQLLHLADNIDKRLERIEVGSEEGKDSASVELSVSPTDEKPLVDPTTSSRHKDSTKPPSDTKSGQIKKEPEPLGALYPTSEPLEARYQTSEARATMAPFVRTSQHIRTAARHPVPNTKPTVIPSPSMESQVANKVPSSGSDNPKVLSGHKASPSSTTITVKNVPAGHLTVTTQVPTSSTVHQAKSALPAVKSTLEDGDRPVPSKDVQEADQSVLEITSPGWQEAFTPAGDTRNAPRHLDALDTVSSDKSGLVAALVFGVMFLVLVIGLVSRKVAEARRRHQYTKLDYLINGMYVDT